MKKRMWVYLLHLSENMWGDQGAPGWKYAPFQPELNIDEAVWRQVIDFLPTQGFNTVLIDVGDAIQYETHPEISVKGAWSKDKLKKELGYMRSIGLTPIPKLNFSTGHDTWLKEYSRMVSTSIYYKVCEDIIKEVAEVFGYPEYFHLGMDEETARNQTGLAFCCIRQADLWWHDVYFFFNLCEKVGARPWVWSDYCWHEPEKFFEKMPKSVLQSNWFYSRVRKNPDGTYQHVAYQTYVKLNEMGYEQVPTSSTWEQWYNSKETMELSRESISAELLKGHMTAPWHFCKLYAIHMLINDAYQFGNAKKEFYPND